MIKWLKVAAAALLLIVLGAYGVDRLLLAPDCPPCHTERTQALPRLGRDTDTGLVRIPVPASGLEYRARVAGLQNKDAEGVILLHGYPETSIMWRPLIDRLAKSGYRVVAFDQRGYSTGARPGSLASYETGKLVADVAEIASVIGFDRFHLVGHDWGGIIGWMAADRYKDRVITWTSLSMPHPLALSEALGEGDQLLRSSYVLLNWVPGLSEVILGFNRAAYMQRYNWRDRTPEQRTEYIEVFSEPGAITAALNWYRAHSILAEDEISKTVQPTLYIWGNRDKSLGRVGAEKTADYVEGPFRMIKLAAGHALMAEVPGEVTDAVLSHIRQWPAGRLPPAADKLPLPQHLRDTTCPPSKPHCLLVDVAPNGKWVHIANRCQERYAGTVRMACSHWSKGEKLDFFFDLQPGGVMLNKASGMEYGACYYDQIVCAPK